MGNLDGDLGFWLQPTPVLVVAADRQQSQPLTDSGPLTTSHLTPLCKATIPALQRKQSPILVTSWGTTIDLWPVIADPTALPLPPLPGAWTSHLLCFLPQGNRQAGDEVTK